MRCFTSTLAVLAAATSLSPTRADACGGCFQPPDVVSTVTDHRMVIALANDQSTLWDQIQYNGNPRDFVWVLPTPAPAMVELADPSFFAALDDRTTPRVLPPPIAQPTSSGPSFGCGGASFAGATRGVAEDEVTVHHQGEVGPYQTATISSKDPMALVRWCNQQGYAVPDALFPTVKFYVDKGWAFNVLRLRPDQSTSQMRPVRVVFPGLAAVFPLRMVAAGAGPSLGILLWVIADQRYQAMNYDTVTIDEKRLRWSTTSNRSNYRELFAATVAEHKGGAFITEFAGPLAVDSLPAESQADMAVAKRGISPERLRLTRLRTSIAPSLLTQDLILTPAPSNDSVSNIHQLTGGQSQSEPIGAWMGGTRGPMMAAALVLLGLALRRRRRS